LCYYVVKALKLCGEEPDKRIYDYVFSLLKRKENARTVTPIVDAYVEVASEFAVTFMATELSKILDVELNRERVTDWLLGFLNQDGGFGARGHSNVNSTYHAVASLRNLGYNPRNLHNTLNFVRSCEKPYGGFTVTPQASTPYMEHTYYGVMALDLLGETCRFPAQTIDFIFNCRNSNGGFARSDLGVSTFENTFQAVSILRKLGMV